MPEHSKRFPTPNLLARTPLLARAALGLVLFLQPACGENEPKQDDKVAAPAPSPAPSPPPEPAPDTPPKPAPPKTKNPLPDLSNLDYENLEFDGSRMEEAREKNAKAKRSVIMEWPHHEEDLPYIVIHDELCGDERLRLATRHAQTLDQAIEFFRVKAIELCGKDTPGKATIINDFQYTTLSVLCNPRKERPVSADDCPVSKRVY